MKCMMLNCKNCSTNLNCMCSDITLETKDGQLVCSKYEKHSREIPYAINIYHSQVTDTKFVVVTPLVKNSMIQTVYNQVESDIISFDSSLYNICTAIYFDYFLDRSIDNEYRFERGYMMNGYIKDIAKISTKDLGSYELSDVYKAAYDTISAHRLNYR